MTASFAGIAGVALVALLTACSEPSADSFIASHPSRPPSRPNPVEVAGLERCVGLERNSSAGEIAGRLPAVDLPCLNEARTVKASRLAGPIVVNLWASWCGPCRKEMPMLQNAARREPDVRFLGINTRDFPEAAAAFLAQTRVTYPQLVDVKGAVLTGTRVPGLPVTLALDADGRVVDRVIGEIADEELATLLETLRGSPTP